MGSRPSGDPKIRAKDIFSSIDMNNDGTLTVEEFVKGEIVLLNVKKMGKINNIFNSGCQTDQELMRLLEKMFETILECRVNLHSVLTKLKIKYMKK